jgi:hypothetical protein
MLLPLARPGISAAGGAKKEAGRQVDVAVAALRRNYREAVRLAAREEILAELADETVTAQLHSNTAHFHHGLADAYAKALDLLLGVGLNVAEDMQAARATTREADLVPMRCQSRHYRSFEPDRR